MSNQKKLLEQLRTLQCHFTWGLKFDTMSDVELFLTYVTHQVKHTLHRNRATFMAMKGFLYFLQKRYATALESFQEAEVFLWQEHPTNHAREVLTIYGDYAWIYYHLTNYRKVKFYLGRIYGTCLSVDTHQPYSIVIPETQAHKGWSLLVGGFHTGQQATACFQIALKSDQSNKEYKDGLAISFFYAYKNTGTEQDMTKAKEVLEEVVKEQPENYLLKVYLANLVAGKDESRALRLLEDAVQNTFSADVMRKAAHLYATDLKWMSRAISILDKAVAMEPSYHFLHYELGSCYKRQLDKASSEDREGLRETAMACFHRAAEIDSLFIYPRLELAKLYGEKDPDDEEEAYLHLLGEMPYFNKACQQMMYLNWGDFLMAKKRQKEEAMKVYMEGLKIFSKHGVKDVLKDRLVKLAELFQKDSAKEKADAIHTFLQATERPATGGQREGP